MKVVRTASTVPREAVAIAIVIGYLLIQHTVVFESVVGLLEKMVVPARAFVVNTTQTIKAPLLDVGSAFKKGGHIRDLERRYAAALSNLARLQTVERENEELRSLLNQPSFSERHTFVVRPIASFSFPTIEGGSQEGIHEGSVITYQQVLLGSVTQTGQHQSKVTLLVSSQHTPILAKTSSGVDGIVVGNGKNVLFTEIPQKAVFAEDELVTTVGQEGVPTGLLIGTIGSVLDDAKSSTKTAIIRQPSSFYDVALVEVW